LTKKECKDISDNIKQDLERAFPGYIVTRVIVKSDSEYTVIADEKKSPKDFYHLYPNLTKAQADDQIVQDMEEIIRRHLPGTQVVDFDQQALDGFRHVELTE